MNSPGWFGKLPMLGDFAHRRLPLDVVGACDAWLSQGIADSRRALGEAWRETYLHAPLWCLAWAPKVVDGHWWYGVMMPSVDAAGRYFPLLVLASSDQAPTPSHALARWYDEVAECALHTLTAGLTLAAFEAMLGDIQLPPFAPPDTGDDAQDTLPQGPDATIDALRMLGTLAPAHSTWWRPSHDETAPPPMVCRGLPVERQFLTLLQGTA